MKRRFPRPIILTFPTLEVKPRLLPFPAPTESKPPARAAKDEKASEAELGEVRDRLFRMIVASEWDRSHGNRAS